MHTSFGRSVFALITFWLLAFLAPLPACGQDSATTAALTGTVRDARGAVIVGAIISLRELATNQTRSATSNDEGSYRFAVLPVGDYEVHVEAQGFARYTNPEVELALGRTTTLDITLGLAGVSEQVTISDRPLAIDPTATGSTISIDPERIAELPVNSRNYLEFTLLAPGVAPSSRQATGGGSSASSSAPLADSGFTFGGLRPRSNAISIDGLDNTDETTGAARVALSPEMAREFQIVNNGQSAEFGGAAGGAINVVTRTGSNDYHGSAFLFFQPARLSARDPLSGADNTGADRRRQFRRYQPGVSLGGPVRRNRIFFYTALEQEYRSTEERSDIDPLVRSRISAGLAAGLAPRLSVRSLSSQFFPVKANETEAAGKLTYLANSSNTLNFGFNFTNLRETAAAFNTDSLSDVTARGSAFTKDYQLTGSVVSVLTPQLINDFRFQASVRRVVTRAGDTNGPGVEIVGLARFGRPFDADATRRETREQVVNNISLSRSRYDLKAGASVNHVSLRNDARDGFGGNYAFRSLDDFLTARPAVWRQAFGDSRTRFDVTSFGGFLQNQLRVTRQLTLNLGARYDITRLPSPFRTDRNNFSPRVGLAYSPASEWVVRAGFGLYYDRLPLAYLNRAIQKNGVQAFEQVATDVTAVSVFAANGGGRAIAPIAGIAPSIFRADPDFSTPYSMQANAGIERLLSTNTTLRADYLFTHGVHLPRTRNINLLPPVTLTPTSAAALGVANPTQQQLGRLVFGTGRIDPRFDSIYQLENSASSTYNGLTFALNKRLSNDSALLASYTISQTIDDASDFDEQPANPYDLRAERALSRHHVGQRFVLSGLFELFGEKEEGGNTKQGGREGLLRELLSDIEVAPIITISSGRPVNALTGVDENRSRAFPFVARPLGFARNTLRTPGFFNVDLRAVKYIPFGERRRLDLVIEFFNLFNHPNAVSLNSFHGSGTTPLSTFGTPTAFAAPRQVRFSIDFEF
jgi:hypothetical protein